MIETYGWPRSTLHFPLLERWWEPTMAVAFWAFRGDTRRLRSFYEDRTIEYVSLGRMLGFEKDPSGPIHRATRRLECALKQGEVAAKAIPQEAFLTIGHSRSRGRPGKPRIRPKDWGPWFSEEKGTSGLVPDLRDLEIDVLMSDGVPCWHWYVSRNDIMRLPDDESEAAARLAAIRNQLPIKQFRLAHLIRELETISFSVPALKKQRIEALQDHYKVRYRGGVGVRTVEQALKALSERGVVSPWV